VVNAPTAPARDAAECTATARQFPTLILEDGAFMYLVPAVGGECPENARPVYRVFNNRPGANHRYTTDRGVRDQMLARGWLMEGDGPDHVVTCAPQ
jgi:hypothetical protein